MSVTEEKSPLLFQESTTNTNYGGLYDNRPSSPPPAYAKQPSVAGTSDSRYTPSGKHRTLVTQTVQKTTTTYADTSDDDHCHTTDTFKEDDPNARRTLWMVSGLVVVFMIGEVVGGFLAGSLAIMTDAAHLLTDVASFMISIFALYLSSRPATRKMSFGWHRAEVLGALISVLLIWVITGVLVYLAIERIIKQQYELNAEIMLITAALGVGVNIVMGLMLHFSGHGHSHGGSGGHSHGGGGHGHSHGQTEDVESAAPDGTKVKVKRRRNLNVRAAFVHVIGDFFQSLGVFTAALIIYFKPNLVILDPICTFLFSILVLVTTIAVIRDALNVLMEGKPKGIEFDHVAESLLLFEGVTRVHNLRIWSLTMDKVAVSAHLAIETTRDPQLILKEASDYLKKEYNVFECTLQLERYTNDMNDCEKCENPY